MQNAKFKIVFIGTPEFGTIVLEGLINAGYKPVLVVTVPDKPVGRKQVLTPPPVKIVAQKYNILVEQSDKIRNLKFEIRNLKPDLGIVAAYGEIIPKDILDIPKYGFLNVHPSLLPKYRGASPIQYAVLNGDIETGVTIMLMDEKMDHGKIISNIKCKISKRINHRELSKELAEIGAKLLVEIIPRWIKKEIKAIPQDETKATYTKIIKKENGKINWKKTAEEIERQIRAFDPWPGTFTFFDGKKLKILKAEISEQIQNGLVGEPGKTFLASDNKIAVQTGKEYLIIEELQLEGKKSMTSDEFLRGRTDFLGKILE